jgi:hypothetical protein
VADDDVQAHDDDDVEDAWLKMGSMLSDEALFDIMKAEVLELRQKALIRFSEAAVSVFRAHGGKDVHLYFLLVNIPILAAWRIGRNVCPFSLTLELLLFFVLQFQGTSVCCGDSAPSVHMNSITHDVAQVLASHSICLLWCAQRAIVCVCLAGIGGASCGVGMVGADPTLPRDSLCAPSPKRSSLPPCSGFPDALAAARGARGGRNTDCRRHRHVEVGGVAVRPVVFDSRLPSSVGARRAVVSGRAEGGAAVSGRAEGGGTHAYFCCGDWRHATRTKP